MHSPMSLLWAAFGGQRFCGAEDGPCASARCRSAGERGRPGRSGAGRSWGAWEGAVRSTCVGVYCPACAGVFTKSTRTLQSVASANTYLSICCAIVCRSARSLLNGATMRTIERLTAPAKSNAPGRNRTSPGPSVGPKPTAHRHERRKVREYLRHVDWEEDMDFPVLMPR